VGIIGAVIKRALLLLIPALAGAAPAAQVSGGRIPVQVIEGRLVTACDLSGPKRRIPVNLFVEFETKSGLQLHNKATAPLGVERKDGSTVPIRVHFPDFKLEVARRELGDEEYLDDFTKYHSAELGENAVVGVLGSEIFEGWHVTFDVGAGWIELTPANGATGERPAPGEAEGEVVVPITVENGLAWLPVRTADGRPAAFAVGTARYDSIVDAALAEAQGRPAGNLAELSISGIDLASYVALRPEEVIQVHPDGVAGVMGVNLLECLRLELDRVNRWARITPRRAPAFPAADVEFFAAMVNEDGDGVEAFLDAHEGHRLAREAAELLLLLRLDEFADEESTQRALGRILETQVEDLKATRAHDLMIQMGDEGELALAIHAGELGIEHGRDDRYPNAVHRIHGRLGDLLLREGQGDQAWRHLLSAAFGLPEDGPINLNLGRFYEGQGRYRRAFSRYVQAVIQPDSGPEALVALERVQPKLADGERFSVDLIDRLIAGKVRNFGAAGRFDPQVGDTTGRVTLVEFFTSADLGDDLAGAIGGALGNQGALGHFEGAPVAFLAWHLPLPQPSPLCIALGERRAADLGVREPTVHVIDGRLRAPGAARWRQAEGVYNALRSAIGDSLKRDVEYELAVEARLEDGQVRGTVDVWGAQWDGLTAYVVLAEKGVLFPGKSTVVVHRMVARASLIGGLDGASINLGDEEEAHLEFGRGLDEIEAENGAWLDQLAADGRGRAVKLSMGLDPRELYVVAFLRDPETGEVLQAATAQLASEESGE
jgi:tetratricopeptide (TPR) repeat protein